MARAFLEAITGDGVMNTALNEAGFIPLKQPYNRQPWNYAAADSVASIPTGVVDWVLVELRSAPAASSRVAMRAAFIKSDGTITDLDGTSPVHFPSVAAGSYFIVLRHRNHLAAMSAAAHTLGPASVLYDFTTGQTQFFGNLAAPVGTAFALYGGDSDADGFVGALDRSSVWNERNQVGYLMSDMDLSGSTGALDRSLTWNNRNMVSQVPEDTGGITSSKTAALAGKKEADKGAAAK
jgi:hypothetical protein